MNNIIYSFIVPHKNNPSLLQRCIDSIPEREDIQIIIVDDYSNEDLKPQIKRVDTQIIYIDKHNSKGAGHARNVGLSKAIGEWLLFPDCDDYYVPGFIKKLDKYIESDIDVLYFNFEYIDGKSGKPLPALPFKKFFDKYDGSENLRKEIKYHHNVPWTKMVRRSFVEKKQIKFEEVPNGNDIFFSLLVGNFSEKIIVEKSPLYIYVKNENSIVTNSNISIESRMCRLEHSLKLRHVYDYVGHPEWKKALFHKILSNIKNGGLPFIAKLIVEFPRMLLQSDSWVAILKKKQNGRI